MTRLLIHLGAWSVLGFFAGLALTWHFVFRSPLPNPLPLPPSLVSVGSSGGHAALAESQYAADYPRLSLAFRPKKRRSFSGVASAVTVLNALREPESPITQSSFFIEPASEIRSSLRVSFSGMTLAHLRDVLQTHGADATAHYASDSDVEAFRIILRANLESSEDFLIVNYNRAALLQEGGSNIAPVAAYHAPTDRILLLDAAVANYPPVWVSVDRVWNAMMPVDGEPEFAGGFVVVREGTL